MLGTQDLRPNGLKGGPRLRSEEQSLRAPLDQSKGAGINLSGTQGEQARTTSDAPSQSGDKPTKPTKPSRLFAGSVAAQNPTDPPKEAALSESVGRDLTKTDELPPHTASTSQLEANYPANHGADSGLFKTEPVLAAPVLAATDDSNAPAIQRWEDKAKSAIQAAAIQAAEESTHSSMQGSDSDSRNPPLLERP